MHDKQQKQLMDPRKRMIFAGRRSGKTAALLCSLDAYFSSRYNDFSGLNALTVTDAISATNVLLIGPKNTPEKLSFYNFSDSVEAHTEPVYDHKLNGPKTGIFDEEFARFQQHIRAQICAVFGITEQELGS